MSSCRYSERVIKRLVAPNPGPMTLSGTNTYLVDDDSGNLAVIDPGPDDPRHVRAILDAARDLGRITLVIVTHRHLDHLPGAAPLYERTGAPLAGHRDLPGVQRPIGDGEMVFGRLSAIETPGHTRDSLCLWDAQDGALFTGDLVAGSGTVVLDEQRGALAEYMASLERLLAFDPRTIYPGHGPVVADATAKLREYLDHRRQRVQQVVDALAAHGPSTVGELVARIYTDVPPSLVAPAGRNVRAVLDMLADQGLVLVLDGDMLADPGAVFSGGGDMPADQGAVLSRGGDMPADQGGVSSGGGETIQRWQLNRTT
jgi:glyoxylase-like metal-dependent hydrolase (beta-lactamase superfamily II)